MRAPPPPRQADACTPGSGWLAVLGVLILVLGASWLALAGHPLPVALIALAAATVLSLWRLADRRRIARLRAVAHAFAASDLAARAELAGSDGIARLGHDLNDLGGRLAAARGELEAQRRHLDEALGVLHEGVACIDHLDRITYANPAWRHLAAGGAAVVGLPFWEHLPASALSAAIASLRTGGRPPEGGLAIEHRRRQLRAVAVPTGDGRDATIVVVLHDLTELRRLETARRDFVAAISHELKTPLTAIAGFAETLLDGALDDPAAARGFVDKIARHADRLAVLVRDVLTLSRLEQGALEVRPEAGDLAQVAREVLDEQQPAAAAREVALVLDASPDPLAAVLDRELVHQLLGNLVSNAIRYNRPQGTVTVRLAALPGERLRLSVADTGIGIPPEHQTRIFERFYRVDAHRSRASGGTGLGLAIVQQAVDALGGTISLESGSAGSTFTVELPRRDPRAAAG